MRRSRHYSIVKRPMPVAISADKSRESCGTGHQTDPDGLVDYTFDLQTELRPVCGTRPRKTAEQFAPPSTDRSRNPSPESAQESGRKTGGQPGHPVATSNQRQAHAPGASPLPGVFLREREFDAAEAPSNFCLPSDALLSTPPWIRCIASEGRQPAH